MVMEEDHFGLDKKGRQYKHNATVKALVYENLHVVSLFRFKLIISCPGVVPDEKLVWLSPQDHNLTWPQYRIKSKEAIHIACQV